MSAADPNDGGNWFTRVLTGGGSKGSRRNRPPTTAELTPETQTHLTRVYTNLGLTSVSSSLASYAYMRQMLPFPSWPLFVYMVVAMFGIRLLPKVPRTLVLRASLLYGFGFAYGWGLGPLVQEAWQVDPSVVFSALSSTAVIFLSLTATAMMTARRSQLYLGGLLSAALSGLLLLSTVNVFAQSGALLNAELYLGLMVFAGYVTYDTQCIVERSEGGHRDSFSDSLELFVDVLGIFVRILSLLSKDGSEMKRSTRRRDDDSDDD